MFDVDMGDSEKHYTSLFLAFHYTLGQIQVEL